MRPPPSSSFKHIMHSHHIIPRHEWLKRFANLKGFNSQENRVLLTAEQHAEVHKLLFELNGNEFDRIAWKTLSGQIGKEEATRLASIFTNKGKKHSRERILNQRKAQTGLTRGPQSIEHRKANGDAQRGRKQSLSQRIRLSFRQLGRKHTQETKDRISRTMQGKIRGSYKRKSA